MTQCALVAIETFHGSRLDLLPLFEQADDSPTEIRSYIELGDVLVARRDQRIVGHVQITEAGVDREIKSVAVIESERGLGIGAALVRAALELVFAAGVRRAVVATATADTDNLRFYQRLGFRMDRIERDVFTVERGYPASTVNGIALRDRIWFSMESAEFYEGRLRNASA